MGKPEYRAQYLLFRCKAGQYRMEPVFSVSNDTTNLCFRYRLTRFSQVGSIKLSYFPEAIGNITYPQTRYVSEWDITMYTSPSLFVPTPLEFDCQISLGHGIDIRRPYSSASRR